MQPLRVLVADDEPLAVAGVRHLLSTHPGIAIVGEHGDGTSALDAVRSGRVDLLLLDIQMPGLDGLTVRRALAGDRSPLTIFMTAFDQYAVAAFEVQAFDYLLKPFSDDRFHAAIARAAGTILRERRAAEPEVFMVRVGNRSIAVPAREVGWISADDYYVRLHVAGKTYLVREPLRALEERLADHGFLRIHRSALVNVRYVVEVRRTSNGRQVAVMRDGARLVVRRGDARALMATMQKMGSDSIYGARGERMPRRCQSGLRL